MRIIRKSKMPDGTNIQIEDWRENYSHIKTLEIAVYPKAKNTSDNGLIENNKIFRLELIKFENDKQVEKVFKYLESGKLKLEQLKEHFYNRQNDEFYLGITDKILN